MSTVTKKDFGECPGCGVRIDGHEYAGHFDGGLHDGNDGKAPLPGDALICEYCATIMVVNPDGSTVTGMLTVEQLIKALGDDGAFTTLALRERALADIRRRSAMDN